MENGQRGTGGSQKHKEGREHGGKILIKLKLKRKMEEGERDEIKEREEQH